MANINRRPIRRKVSNAKFLRIGRHPNTNTAFLPIDYEAATKANVPYAFKTEVIVSVLDEVAYYKNALTGECWAWRLIIQEHLQGKPYLLIPIVNQKAGRDWEVIYLEAKASGFEYKDTEAYQVPHQYKYNRIAWLERLDLLRDHFKINLEN